LGNRLDESPAATLQRPEALSRPVRGDIGGLAWAAAGLGLALVAQSEAGAGRSGNAVALFLLAAAAYLYSRPLLAVRARRAAAPALDLRQLREPLAWMGLAAASALLALVLFGRLDGLLLPWAFYLAGVGCLLLAAWTFPRPKHRRLPLTGAEWFALTAILVWGAFLRLHRLDSFPAGIYYDEAVNAMEGLRALAQQHFPAYFSGDLGYYGRFGALYEYWVGSFLTATGSNEITLRLTAALPGLLALPIFYRLARELFDRPVALAAVLLLAGSRWHANFSRIAFDAVMVPTLLPLALLFLLRALRRGGRGDYVLSGLCLGLGLLTYTAFRLAPLLLLAVPAIYWLLGKLPAREALIGLALLGLATLVAATPEVRHYLSDPESFTERTKRLSLVGERTYWDARDDILESAKLHLGMFNLAGDRNGRHNLPGAPMLHPLVGVLFILGLALCLGHLRSAPPWVLLAWIAIMMAGGGLSVLFEAPQSLRSIGALPAVYLIATLPLADLWRRWRSTFGTRRWPLLVPVLAAALVWLLFGTYDTFFRRQANDFAVWNAFSTAETRMALAIRERGEGRRVYVDPLLHGQPTVRFLLPDYQEPEPFVAQELLPLAESGERGVQVFVRHEHQSLARLLARWYPAAEIVIHQNPADGQASMFEFMIAPADIEATRGLLVNVAGAGETGQSLPAPTLDLDLEAGRPLPVAVTWSGVLVAPASGMYRFRLEAPGQGQLVLDGAVVAAAGDRDVASVYLARGRHELWAQVAPESAGTVRARWRPPGAEEFVSVPAAALYRAPIEGGGLQGDYLAGAGDDWSHPVFSRIDPWVDLFVHRLPLERPYRVRWHGWLVPPQPGLYELSLSARDRAQLWINGEPVLETGEPEVPVTLTVGLDAPLPVEVRFWDETGHTRVQLRWKRPDGLAEVVPTTALQPPVPVVGVG